MRAVLDTNVVVSALTSKGPPAQLLRLWLEGAFEIVASPNLLDELSRTLSRPKIRRHIAQADGAALVSLIESGCLLMDDPTRDPTVRSSDPDDNFVIALAEHAKAVIVSGDKDLLELADRIPVWTPAQFLERL
ncbi:MAG: putative toxin-antitoxin system toxin component, PIN family [Acidimicrobiia bacterium]|nr:putative toxin-antitoxin system toxin component, PIN family [Acidimicrobiia bacterium]